MWKQLNEFTFSFLRVPLTNSQIPKEHINKTTNKTCGPKQMSSNLKDFFNVNFCEKIGMSCETVTKMNNLEKHIFLYKSRKTYD